MACEWCELCGVDGGVIEVYTLQAIMSRRVILGAFVPESPTAKSSEYGMWVVWVVWC